MYEDYIGTFFDQSRQYPNMYQNTLENYPYSSMYRGDFYDNMGFYQDRNTLSREEIESYYPEIYNIVYPMVRKVCSQNRGELTGDTIDRMVEEVYSNVETDNSIVLNINLENDVRGTKVEKSSEKLENRATRRNLNDLIRILILRELLGRPGCIGPNCRPPFPPPRPPRPPMRPNPRPPMGGPGGPRPPRPMPR